MKEITRIINVQITSISKMDDKTADMEVADKNIAEERIKREIKTLFDADDVLVDIHDFVMDKDD